MREIPLSRGKVALVSDEDYENISQYKWYAHFSSGKWYAYRNAQSLEGKRQTISIHRSILDVGPISQVDHIDGDGLNNIRTNLRPATKLENSQNKGRQWNNTSGFKGVSYFKRTGRWVAHISIGGKNFHLGFFSTREEAARAYDEAALAHYGQFARLNFPEPAA